MFPYFHFEYLTIFGLKLYTWGFFTALAFLIPLAVLVKKHKSQKEIFIDITLYALIGAMIGARLFFLLFYGGGISALSHFYKIWEGGMASMGGFIGAFLAIWLYVRIKKLDFLDLLEKIAFVLPLGLAIGRIACYIINDHPGIYTPYRIFAVTYPDGIRFDLGLLLFALNTAIFIYFLLKKKGNYLESFLILYGIGRFLLDFLRVGEPVAYGLIPSQYATIILVVIGVILRIKNIKVKKQN